MNKLIPLTLLAAIAAAGCGTEIEDDDQSTAEEAVVSTARDKTKSPESDLVNFPKLAAPGDRAPTQTPDFAPTSVGLVTKPDDVYTVEMNDEGGGTMTIYTPPAGVTAYQLHDALREQGVAGLQDPGTDAFAPAVATASESCWYGGGSLFRCAVDPNWAHQIHWANNGFSRPQVYFVDHSGSNWPVDTSTYQWNKAHGIDSKYHWSTCPNIAGVHCVSVVDSNYGNSCWQGRTTVSWNGAYNIISATVQFNDFQGGGVCGGHNANYKKNSSGYRQDACHELGHALGMGHNTKTSGSCLYGTIMNSSSMLLPSSDDYALLSKLYSTDH